MVRCIAVVDQTAAGPFDHGYQDAIYGWSNAGTLAKKEIPGLKVVILSGYDDFNYAKQAIGIGVEDYLLKPITKNALIERLSEIRSRYEHEKHRKNITKNSRERCRLMRRTAAAIF